MSERERDRDRERRSRRSRRDRDDNEHGDGAASVRSSRRSAAAAPASAAAPAAAERGPPGSTLAPPPQHGRPASSRFSLRNEFATTRSEIEFGFDDASSYVQSIAASRGGGGPVDDPVVVDHPSRHPAAPSSGPPRRDYYELLCLEKRGAALYPEEVKAALRRLTLVLAVEQQSEHLQGPAGFYLGLAQAAYEGLVDPSRRIGYDLSGAGEPNLECDGDADVDEFLSLPVDISTYETRLQDQYQLLTRRDARATTDLGLRLDARSLITSKWGSWGPINGGVEALDFSVHRSSTVPITGLGRSIENTMFGMERFFDAEEDGEKEKKAPHRIFSDPDDRGPIHCPDPTITFTGSTHGLLDDPFKMASLLLDRYQPPGPSIHSRRRMEQLLTSRFLPVLSVAVRQELAWREQKTALLRDIVVEQEVEVLPHPSATLRLGYSLNLTNTDKPLNIEVSARKLLTFDSNKPSFAVATSKQFRTGTAFLVADGGNWNLRPSKECTDLSKFEKVSKTFVPLTEAFRNPPTCEVGYAFGRHDLGLQAGQALTKPSQHGLPGLDYDADEHKSHAWTISTGLTPGNVAGYLRYGKDFFSSLFSPTLDGKKKSTNNFRAEVELAGTAQKDFYMAFRALKRLGKFSKAGLEVGVSPSNLHLSLYYSRLGQRISLPFLVATRSKMLNPKLLFWSTIFPFAALAAWELYSQKRRRTSSQALAKENIHKKALQNYISKRRAEADELTVILATGVEPRQQLERQRGGLVILSAKYGVKDAPFDEIADVTIAVAALVDSGRLVIPKGLRKGRLLGFWDPAPLSTKVLTVRYLWRGKERTVEVCGRDELSLP